MEFTTDFPWKRNHISRDELMRRFENLKNYTANFVDKPYKIYNMPYLQPHELYYNSALSSRLLALDPKDYVDVNEISDYFIEPSRALARHGTDPSMLEYWEAHKDEIKKKAVQEFNKAGNYELREALYKSMFEVGTFRPSVAAAMAQHFNFKRVLDCSAGWGDRLLGFIAKGVDVYTGVDPNSKNHLAYMEMLQEFPNDTQVNLICDGFETAEIPAEFTINGEQVRGYDAFFTSPPYFAYEIYDDSPKQSHFIKDWFNDFLMYSLKKAWALMTPGAKFIVIITDVRNQPKYTCKMISEMNKLPDSRYEGVISYAEVSGDKIRSPQPMWIWTKLAEPLKYNVKVNKLLFSKSGYEYAKREKSQGRAVSVRVPEKADRDLLRDFLLLGAQCSGKI